MEQVIDIVNTKAAEEDDQFSIVDTTFVLFFLAVDIGSSVLSGGFGLFLGLTTLVLFAVLPYFLPTYAPKADFKSWVLGRLLIACFALIIGILFSGAVGTILPETFKFLPLTLLIITALASCYLQFYGIMKFRLAR